MSYQIPDDVFIAGVRPLGSILFITKDGVPHEYNQLYGEPIHCSLDHMARMLEKDLADLPPNMWHG